MPTHRRLRDRGRRKARYRCGWVTLHRTGFAPVGRQTKFHDITASSLPFDQPCLVALCNNSSLGAGVGPAFVTVAGVRFSDEYRDTAVNSDVYDPPLSFYNTSLDDDLSDTVLARHLHAGTDVRIADRTWLGLKMTYSMLGDIETRGGYDLHAAHALDPDFEYHDTFTAARSWALMFTGKYAFDN